jgi:tetratricopeptide (TPR) repeat protein
LIASLVGQWDSLPTALSHQLCVLAAEVDIASGNPQAALDWLCRARDKNPADAWVSHLSAIVLRDLDQIDSAIAAWHVALRLNPGLDQAYQGLASTLSFHGSYDEAEDVFARWASLRPDHARLWLSRGLNRARAADYTPAEHFLRTACRLADPWPEALTALAWVLRRQGALGAATAVLQQALTADPDYAEARWALASVLLLQGDYEQGFAAFEWRLRRGRAVLRPCALPQWRGGEDPLQGRRLLVLQEQGLGDAFQMVRFAADLAARGARVLWEAPAPAAALLARVAGVEQVVAAGAADGAADLCCPMMSLPHLLAVTAQTVPAPARYITAVKSDTPMPLPLASDTPYRIGVVWRGNPNHEDDEARSVPLPWWQPLLTQPLSFRGRRVEWVALQPLDNRADFDPVEHQGWFAHDLGAWLSDFDRTAQALEALDLLVSVDTAPLHLSAALGRPTWGLLPFASDWRWCLPENLPNQGQVTGQPGEASLWYPSLRLFRCAHPFTRTDQQKLHWQQVLAQLKTALTDDHRSGGPPGL